MNEAKKGVRKPIYSVKTKNPVAKAHQTVGTGSGAHKDKKKAMKQGETKHKNKEYAEGLQTKLDAELAEAAKHGLYYNVNKRKKAGTSRPASSPKAPTAQAWKDAAKTAKKESRNEDRFDNAEYNDEAGMAYGSLHTLKRAVDGLMNTIESHDDLPEWCQEKISLAEDYLVTVWDYLQSEKEQGIEPKQEATALDQHRRRSDQSDADFAKRELKRKKNPGSTLEPTLQKLEKRYQPKEGIAGGSQHGIPEANVRDIIWKMFKIDAPTAQEALNLAVKDVAQRLKANPNSRMLNQVMGDLEAIASRAHIRVASPKLESFDRDALADQLFEHERTYEEKLANELRRILDK